MDLMEEAWNFMLHSIQIDLYGVISQKVLSSSRNKKLKPCLKDILLKE
jgi:hypothetical protein